MPVQNQKRKLLAVLEILMQKTDEHHVMSAQDICKVLESTYGITAERKGIYADVEALQDMGFDVVQNKGTGAGYHIGSREFELAELKLLVDAVQSSKFITEKKSENLIKKLEKLTSVHEAKQLHRQVFICDRAKAENEKSFYTVDRIYTAFSENVQVQFQYLDWTVKKELVPRRDGAYYVVSPWAMIWDDENYYLVAYDANADMLKHYRVDLIQNLSLLEEARLGKEKYQTFDLPAFSKKTFSMYGGKDEKVTLRCKNKFARVILDRFGKDVMMLTDGNAYFKAKVLVTVSEPFFGWITGLGKDVEIVGPEQVRSQYEEYLREILKQYRKEE